MLHRIAFLLIATSGAGFINPAVAGDPYAYENPAPALSDEAMIEDARRFAAGIQFGQSSLKQHLMALKAEADQQSSASANMPVAKTPKPEASPENSAMAAGMADHAAPSSADNPLATLKLWHKLTEQASFAARKKALADQLEQWAGAPYSNERSQALTAVKENYSQLLHDFNAGEYLFSAKIAAEKARHNLEMYREMKYVKQSGPERDRAHALFADAEQAMQASSLASALKLWEQTAKAFNENAFQEVIDGFIAANNAGEKRAHLKLEAIRLKVAAILEDYFVTVPAGTLHMGSNGGDADEQPPQTQALDAFNLGRVEVSNALWDLCVQTRACYRSPEHHASSDVPRERLPVAGVSAEEVLEQFIPWLQLMTGQEYRLPTEAEWEYAAKAGSDGPFSWGQVADCHRARFKGRPSEGCLLTPMPAATGQYPANAFGLHDMLGNVWEWTQSCYTSTLNETASKPCKVGVIRGGSWRDGASAMRVSNRSAYPFNRIKPTLGFRLVEIPQVKLGHLR